MTAARQRRRRADAERSIARIISAAREQLAADPNANVDDIARAAGVGRMTLYGHFRTRADLVEAALLEALRVTEETLSAVDLTGDARSAMSRLLASSWSKLDESAGLLAAADGVVSDQRLRELHEEPAKQVEILIRRGQDQGAFRTDLPTDWLVSTVHLLLHGAMTEVRAGRLAAGDAPEVVTKTVQAVLAERSTYDEDGCPSLR